MNTDDNNKQQEKVPIELLNKARDDILEKQECRDVVREIMNFNVSQRQIIEIINLLALELEDTEQMRTIRNAIKEIKGDAVVIMKTE